MGYYSTLAVKILVIYCLYKHIKVYYLNYQLTPPSIGNIYY